jgi:HlyD family secretion protein
MEIAAQNRIQVKLGVEPTDSPYLKAGQTVLLHRLEGSSDEIEGKIRFVGKRVDPTTRLVELLVTLPPDAHLILDSFIAGEITRQTARGLIVPRESILAEEGGEHGIFTVEGGKAKEHKVQTGIETKSEVLITADDVKAGDTVVTVGALELEDGMKVEVKEPTTEPATAPATTSPAKSEASP